jgi:squalene synthase HpnC
MDYDSIALPTELSRRNRSRLKSAKKYTIKGRKEQPARIASPGGDTYILVTSHSGARLTADDAFKYCERVARRHYENFPVASLLLPRRQRRYVAAVYAFARTADDFADEGLLSPEDRLAKLDAWEEQLYACYAGKADHPIFIAMAETVARTGIPPALPAALLRAFRMDVTRHRYRSFQDLLGYCENSANPVGRLILLLFDAADETTLSLSDRICTALQLTNFWQDVALDHARSRIYIPLEDFERFGYTEDDLERRIVDNRFRALMEFQVERTRRLFREGAPLLAEVGQPLRFEIALTLSGGSAVLSKIETQGYDVLNQRPALSVGDKLSIFATTIVRGVR